MKLFTLIHESNYFEYDQAINIQRNLVYAERRRVFEKPKLRKMVIEYAERSLYDLFNRFKVIEDKETINFFNQ